VYGAFLVSHTPNQPYTNVLCILFIAPAKNISLGKKLKKGFETIINILFSVKIEANIFLYFVSTDVERRTNKK
jgi:hypothetical protein